MKRQPVLMIGCLCAAFVAAAGCNFGPAAEPTALIQQPTASLTATAAAVREVLPTRTPVPPLLITPASTPTPITPSVTPTITETPGPIRYEIQEGDQLIAIVRDLGHRSLAVMDEVVALNPNVPSVDRLPPPGSIILVPRPTPTATPPGGEITATFLAQFPSSPTPELQLITHIVETGQTIVGIIAQYDVPMYLLRELNPWPSVDWTSCDPAIPSGGEDCNPVLSVGQEILVPAPTATPTLSPTPSGSETPTPTPTYAPPALLWPSPGDIIQGGPLTLRWVSAGMLQPDEYYQVTLTDHTASTVFTDFTRANSLALPVAIQPGDAVSHDITWRVEVVRVQADHAAVLITFPGEERPFQWRSP